MPSVQQQVNITCGITFLNLQEGQWWDDGTRAQQMLVWSDKKQVWIHRDSSEPPT